jgi:hypothetical protein
MNPSRAVLLFALALLVSLNGKTVYAAGCGILPIKPIVPLGCKDLSPQCVCDSTGNNCQWEWVGVK